MTKYVINTVEIVKRVYVVDAYTEKEALDKHLDQAPDKVEFIGELTYSVETINEHEYNQDWKPKWEAYKKEWKREKKDHEGYQYDAFKDQDIYRDD